MHHGKNWSTSYQVGSFEGKRLSSLEGDEACQRGSKQTQHNFREIKTHFAHYRIKGSLNVEP